MKFCQTILSVSRFVMSVIQICYTIHMINYIVVMILLMAYIYNLEIIEQNSIPYDNSHRSPCWITRNAITMMCYYSPLYTKRYIREFGMRTMVTLCPALVERSPPRVLRSHCLGVSQTAHFTFMEASPAASYVCVRRLIVAEAMAGFLALFCRTACCGRSETPHQPELPS